MNTTIAALDGSIRVGDYSIAAVSPMKEWGTTGTLYNGDADLIADFIADPQGELDVYGVIHHINMRYDADVYTLSINFMGDVSEVHFDHLTAREIVLALMTVTPYQNNPNR